MNSKKLNILCIDSEKNEQEYYQKILSPYSSNITILNNSDQLLDTYDKVVPNLIISDVANNHQIDMNNLATLKKINPYLMVIIRTNLRENDLLLKAFEIGIDGYLLKSDNEDKFINKLESITNKFNQRNENIQKRKTLEKILDNQSGIILLTDFENITYASKSFLDFFELRIKDDIFNRYENILDIFIQHDEYLYADTKEDFLEKFQNAKAINKIVLILGKDFNPKAFHIHLDKISKNEELYVISLSNISFMQEKNIEISYKAYIDGLTHVYNRNKFEETFDYEFNKFKRYESPFCISILDIDHFKKFNDTYGHLIGDEVLILLAEKINQNIRSTDTFARWGGEEFVVLMPNTKIDEAKIFCEKLRILVEEICHITAGKITCSFGITQTKKEDTLKAIFKRCDEALYHAKAAGRNRIEIKE